MSASRVKRTEHPLFHGVNEADVLRILVMDSADNVLLTCDRFDDEAKIKSQLARLGKFGTFSVYGQTVSGRTRPFDVSVIPPPAETARGLFPHRQRSREPVMHPGADMTHILDRVMRLKEDAAEAQVDAMEQMRDQESRAASSFTALLEEKSRDAIRVREEAHREQIKAIESSSQATIRALEDRLRILEDDAKRRIDALTLEKDRAADRWAQERETLVENWKSRMDDRSESDRKRFDERDEYWRKRYDDQAASYQDKEANLRSQLENQLSVQRDQMKSALEYAKMSAETENTRLKTQLDHAEKDLRRVTEENERLREKKRDTEIQIAKLEIASQMKQPSEADEDIRRLQGYAKIAEGSPMARKLVKRELGIEDDDDKPEEKDDIWSKANNVFDGLAKAKAMMGAVSPQQPQQPQYPVRPVQPDGPTRVLPRTQTPPQQQQQRPPTPSEAAAPPRTSGTLPTEDI